MTQTKLIFFHRKDYVFDWKTMDDLKTVEVGATIGYFYGEAFKKAEESGKVKVQRAAQDLLNFKKLLIGRIQIFVIEKNVGLWLLLNNFTSEEIMLLTYHSHPVNDRTHHLILSRAVNRNNRLIEEFNKELNILKETGRYDQFIEEFQRGDYLKK